MVKLAYPRLRRRQSRDLSALIDLYEGNYWRLYRLVPDLDVLDGAYVSRVSGALALHLTVLDRFKYTTSLRLTYRFRDAAGYALEPNARVCVYHDVRAVELLGHCRRGAKRSVLPWRRGHMPEIDRKWDMNRFLLKWLKFCAHQGHMFLACTARPGVADLRDAHASGLQQQQSN